MNAYHLHVITPVLTLWAVLSAPVIWDMYWIVMDYPVMVSKYDIAMHINKLNLPVYIRMI